MPSAWARSYVFCWFHPSILGRAWTYVCPRGYTTSSECVCVCVCVCVFFFFWFQFLIVLIFMVWNQILYLVPPSHVVGTIFLKNHSYFSLCTTKKKVNFCKHKYGRVCSCVHTCDSTGEWERSPNFTRIFCFFNVFFKFILINHRFFFWKSHPNYGPFVRSLVVQKWHILFFYTRQKGQFCMKVRKSACVFSIEFGMVYTRTYDSTGDFFVEFEHPRAKARTGDEHNGNTYFWE